MYKVASSNRQSALHRGRLADWVHGEESLTPEAEHASLKLAMDGIERQLAAGVTSEQRRELGQKKFQMQQRAAELKPTIGMRKRLDTGGLAQCFIEATKEMVLPAQFKMIMRAAERKYDELKAELEKAS